jgi:two-component system KDP operon response regulator KdpE
MTRAARILLVDDEVSQRAVVPLLRSRGYEVETVATGSDALKAVAVHAPDLVVLDLGLPDLEGTAVCRRIREESPVPIEVDPGTPRYLISDPWVGYRLATLPADSE